tara:strand:- start:1523 stop:2677 length:1155 start_codon:yes stop_codon:yes gene_type:complete
MKDNSKWEQFKNLSFVGGPEIIGNGITAIFWFFLASQLSVEEFGELHYFIAIAGFTFIGTLIGTQNTITVLTAKGIRIEGTLFTISLVTVGIGSMFVLLLTQRIDSSMLVLAYAINDLSIAYMLGKKFFSTYGKNIFLQKVLTCILGITFFYLFGAEGIIFAIILSYGHFSFYIFKILRKSSFNFNLVRENSKFILNNWFLNLIGMSRSHLDKIILVPYLGLTVMGNYSLALQFWAILIIFSNILFKYFLTYDASGVQNNRIKSFAVIISIITAAIGIIVLPMIIPVFFEKFMEVTIAIQIMSIGTIPVMIDKIFVSELVGQKKTKTVFISRITNACTLILGILILGPDYGLAGISVAFVLSFVFQVMVIFLIDYRHKLGNKIN